VIGCLKSLSHLDRGVEVQIGNDKVLLCAFTMAYTGDMPQQQENSGYKSQNAKLGCRFCFISDEERGNLDYDIFNEGRYHHQAIAMRDHMNALRTKTARAAFAQTWGLDTDNPPLLTISPALDIILTRPGDPAHSEYKGLSRLLHTLLLDEILTSPAKISYAAELRKFPFPPGWPRVQGPLHHLKSYSLSEYARASIVIPPLLRCWLRESFIAPFMLTALEKVSSDPVSMIISCFAAAAKCNCLLMGEYLSQEDRRSLSDTILDFRSKFQNLYTAAASAVQANPRRARSVSVQGSRAGTPGSTSLTAASNAPQVPPGRQGLQAPLARTLAHKNLQTATQEETRAKKAKEYINNTKLPNVHAGLHYPASATEFGLTGHHQVLIGEDKHR
jgi:hypothetical protein